MVGALSQSLIEPWLGASVAQPGRCFSTPESIRLVSGKARLPCPAGSRVQTPPEAPKTNNHFRFIPRTPPASRDTLLLSPPPLFLEKIFCLVGFLGEYRDSGHGPGLNEKAEKREIINDSRTNYGRNFSHDLDSRSGLKMGDFPISL